MTSQQIEGRQEGLPGAGDGRWVHHRCGYPLWVTVLSRFADGEDGCYPTGCVSVLVSYWDMQVGMVVFCCSRCGQPLKLWWQERI